MRRSLLQDASAVHMVPSVGALELKFTNAMRRRGVSVRESLEPLTPRVDHGRWLADCPACNAGIALTPGVAAGFCFGCGHRFTMIVWPDAATVDDIERTLRARPKVATRNWLPTETVAQLEAENIARQLPARHDAPRAGRPN